jgi:hypothetical protein
MPQPNVLGPHSTACQIRNHEGRNSDFQTGDVCAMTASPLIAPDLVRKTAALREEVLHVTCLTPIQTASAPETYTRGSQFIVHEFMMWWG